MYYIVDVLAEMFEMRSAAIGNAYRVSDYDMLKDPSMIGVPISPDPVRGRVVSMPFLEHFLGKVVSMAFFWDKHITQDIERGPFYTSQQWLKKRLFLARSDAEAVIAKSSNKGELKNAETTLGLVIDLMELMPKCFEGQRVNDGIEWCCMHHDDLSWHNILVNRTGMVNGILDWECVHYVPLWMACRIPDFLRSCNRMEKPVQNIYARNKDGPPSRVYLEHRREYELTLLRQVFFARMAQVQPLWTDVHQASGKKRDFWFAVENCDVSFLSRVLGNGSICKPQEEMTIA